MLTNNLFRGVNFVHLSPPKLSEINSVKEAEDWNIFGTEYEVEIGIHAFFNGTCNINWQQILKSLHTAHAENKRLKHQSPSQSPRTFRASGGHTCYFGADQKERNLWERDWECSSSI